MPVLLLAFAFFTLASSQSPSDTDYQLIAPLPNSLLSDKGNVVESSADWEQFRREEVLELFSSDVYGRIPETEVSIDFKRIYVNKMALGESAVMKEVEVLVSQGAKELSFTILLFLPSNVHGAVPLFLGLNFNGNHTVHPCEEISISDSWVRKEETRGSSASRWPVEMILSKGYGVATVYCGDIDPDFDDGFVNGIQGLMQEKGEGRSPDSWGTIAAWAWGLSRAMDYIETDPAIDHNRVAVIGHSRLGKTSLWAGALDERFAMVVSNNSGCGGASLSRRPFGERVSAINRVFPHWFASKFHEYDDNEAACPVDQHMLLALMAPRPLYVASASKDEWADPRGEYLSLLSSGDVYGLYGEDVLEEALSPELNQPRWVGKQAYHIRDGKHDITSYDWEQYLAFADLQLGTSAGERKPNPVSMEWIRECLPDKGPKLILSPELEAQLKEKLASGDNITTMGFQLLEQKADALLKLETLAYEKQGRRLLGVSREALNRITTLALAYRLKKDQRYLQQLEREMLSVCTFKDWNPNHFLDVAEMACAVALGLDWAGEYISPELSGMAKNALVEKALKPGIAASANNFWKGVDHNWNLVCNGGLAMAALVVFEDEPELSSAILHQAVETIPLALIPYAPSGVYPEGVSYWSYATAYLTLTISAFESALGTDFGFADYPGIMESRNFSMLMAGPTGSYYNYFDSGLGGYKGVSHLGLLAWFSKRTGEGLAPDEYEALFEENLLNPGMIRGSRFYGIHLLDIATMEIIPDSKYSWPATWWGDGPEPILVMRDKGNDPDSFFLAAKGGMAGDNHGNMDAGSFIFEQNGIRWSVDPGNQDYNTLEQLMGMGLWENGQDSERWTLLTKSNFGHSTLTINGQKHLVDGRVALTSSDIRGQKARCTFDLSPLFGDNIQSAHRTFSREEGSLIISDELVLSKHTESVTWQMITTASLKMEEKRLVLAQDGKKLYLYLRSDQPLEARVIELSPPPLRYDKDIPDLKRIELSFDRAALDHSSVILVELTQSK